MSVTHTITFDDITAGTSAPVPDGYSGFNWVGYDPLNDVYGGNISVTNDASTINPGSYAVKGLGFQMKLAEAGTFDAITAVLAAEAFGPDAPISVTIKGYLAGSQIFEKIVTSSTGYGRGPVDVGINCYGVDELLIYGDAIEIFSVDSIVVSEHLESEDKCDMNEFFICRFLRALCRLFR